MDMTIRPIRAEEQKYTCKQSQQLKMQIGAIGYLRGDFGKGGKEFYSTWFDQVKSRKTDGFKDELDQVVNALRFDKKYGGLLAERAAMRHYGEAQPDSVFQGDREAAHGFRIDTEQFVYLLRCNLAQGDYDFTLWCYEEKLLDYHLQKARKGILFIDPQYREKFRIPDGDRIRIIRGNGTWRDCSCRYIDEYHVEVGSGWNSLFHICQFAEIMEQNGSTVIPLRSSLPEQCYIYLPTSQEIGIVKKGESGYYRSSFSPVYGQDGKTFVDDLNRQGGVTKAQAEAMCAGSMFGWGCPAADPKSYDENGHLQKPKYRDRGGAR